ncbi:hypothetical protein M3148_00515 [Georgenia satyanarayanai]|uniref:hypothetical protein n=1 Tax=Georgenia satyanarayanai TaxID=860221 RepID=UPI00203F932E|nr:hypothetical protein [Georgenia satyanarayanai]MCM3659484.1 hypothetical protein [Georgenia satyanarayanai]
MDDVQQETTATPEATVRRPDPCATRLVGGLSVTVVGVGFLAYGLFMYIGHAETTGNASAVVLGCFVAAVGLTIFLGGVLRAAEALDYLVRTR